MKLRFIQVLICSLFFVSCWNSTTDKIAKNRELLLKKNKLLVDSLIKIDYNFIKNIDYNVLINKDSFYPLDTDLNYFAIKREKSLVRILKIKDGNITNERILKGKENYFIEEIIIDSSDGGEINYIYYLYSSTKILIIEITESIFEEGIKDRYVSKVFNIENDTVKTYSYRFNDKCYLDDKFDVSKTDPNTLDEEKLISLFYDTINIDKDIYPFKRIMKNHGYIWGINSLNDSFY